MSRWITTKDGIVVMDITGEVTSGGPVIIPPIKPADTPPASEGTYKNVIFAPKANKADLSLNNGEVGCAIFPGWGASGQSGAIVTSEQAGQPRWNEEGQWLEICISRTKGHIDTEINYTKGKANQNFVYINTANIPDYYKVLGGDPAKFKARGLALVDPALGPWYVNFRSTGNGVANLFFNEGA
jgi:hypothetical protein